MSAHTPGPWYADGSQIDSKERMVAKTLAASLATRNADARLIAAAPDLLGALLRMRDEVREFLPNVCGDALTEAEAAIAKATGGDR